MPGRDESAFVPFGWPRRPDAAERGGANLAERRASGPAWPGIGLATGTALLVMFAACAVLALAFDLELVGFAGPAVISLQFGLGAALLRRRLPDAVRTRAVLEGLATLSLIALAAMVFSYGFQLLGFPLRDGALQAADRALGLDPRRLLDVVEARPALHAWISQAYFSFVWQILLTVLGFALLRRPRRMEQFLLAFGLALFATCAISGLLPATSLVETLRKGYHELRFGGASPVEHILALRDGSLRRLEVGTMGGIVSFPSFHTATAVLVMLAWRRTPVIWPLLPLNALLLVGAITEGAHYVVDLLAGSLVGLAAWGAARSLLGLRADDPDHVSAPLA